MKVAQTMKSSLGMCHVKMARIQRSIVAGSAAILKLIEAFTQASKASSKGNQKGDDGQLELYFKTGLHALALLGYANYDISLRRRDSMRPLLKQDLAGALCGPDIPVTTYLFGDDFTKSLKDVTQVAQMGRDTGKRHDRNFKSEAKNFSGKWKGWKPPYHKKGSKKDDK